MAQSSTSTGGPRARLAVEHLEDRTTPTFLTRVPGEINVNGINRPTGGLSIASGDLYPDNAINAAGLVENEFVLGTGPGTEATVAIYGRAGNLRNMFTPFPGFRGGINVTVGDVLGDSQAEIIVTPATGGPPVVAVFNAQGQALSSFFVLPPFYNGGLNVTVGNVLGGISAGGFNSGFTNEFAEAVGRTGVRPANQFKQEIIVGTATQSSLVMVTDGFGNVQRDFFAFDPAYTGGVTLAAASVDKRRDPGYNFLPGQQDTASYDEIIVGAASNFPAIRVYSVWEGGVGLEQSFFAYSPTAGRGVNVAAGPTDGIRGAEIYANLITTSVIRTFDGVTQEQLGETQVFPPNYSRVLNMTVAWFANFGLIGSGPVPPTASYDPTEDFFEGFDNFDFSSLDLAVVSGDGPFFQQPRLFTGAILLPAPFNGP